MTFDRRSFLIGAGSGLSLLVLSACTVEAPSPKPTRTVGPTPTGDVPAPKAFARSSWSTDQFARGSHSYMKVGSTPDDRANLAVPIADRVFFAGEATSSDKAGTLAGARESGKRAAADVAKVAVPGDKVTVIGAGAAGAEAASMLALYGYEVTVIEARDRIGGRIHTLESTTWPVPVELGAWLLNEKSDSATLDDLRSLDIATALLSTVDHVAADGTHAEAAAVTIGSDAVKKAVEWAVKQQADVPLAVALDSSGATDAAAGRSAGTVTGAEALTHYLATLALVDGAASADLSTWYGMSADPEDERRAVIGKLSALVTDALGDARTYLSTTVTGVSYNESGVSLRLGTGESLTTDRVVVTVPLGVLQNHGITFTPLLPFTHRTAIDALGMGTVDSVWLRFDTPFWSTDATVWNLEGTDDDITTWINLEPVTGEAVLVGLVGGDAALRLADLSDDALLTAAQIALQPFAS